MGTDRICRRPQMESNKATKMKQNETEFGAEKGIQPVNIANDYS